MRELHWTAKTEQKLALGGWHSANALALLFENGIKEKSIHPVDVWTLVPKGRKVEDR